MPTIHNYVRNDETFTHQYEKAVIDEERIGAIGDTTARVVVISAYWCPDCQRNVPLLAKIANHLPNWNIEVYDSKLEGVKEKYAVERIPTIIVYRLDGKEVGRVVENPKHGSLERDLVMIMQGTYE